MIKLLNTVLLIILLTFNFGYTQGHVTIERNSIASEPKIKVKEFKTPRLDIDDPAEPHWGDTQIDRLEVKEPVSVEMEDPQSYLSKFYDDHLLSAEPAEPVIDEDYIGNGCPKGMLCDEDDPSQSLEREPPYTPGEMYVSPPKDECPPFNKCN